MIRMRLDLGHAAFAFGMGVFVLGMLTVHPPSPRPADAPAERFSAERAAAHVEQLARQPHPAGSTQQGEALSWLLQTLTELGVQPEVQSGLRRSKPLSNVLVRLSGRTGEGAVLIQAHYDSVPAAPGAGDNASGVAALLETLRAVLPGAPYRNDLIFHFDDGEEYGLLGAKMFAEEHPWMKDVRCVLNFDARGNAGTPLCFEVGPGSERLIAALADGAEEPIAASVAEAVYARLPNDTSFSPFRDRGLPGLNFAMVGGASAYHQPWDTPENLSRRTLQRLGDFALAMTLATAEMDLDELGDQDAVFFNWADGRLTHYPMSWIYPLALLPAALVLLLVSRARNAAVPLFMGLLYAVVLAAIVFAGSWAAWWLIAQTERLVPLLGIPEGSQRGNLVSSSVLALGVLSTGVAIALAFLERIGKHRKTLDACAVGGTLVCLALLGVILFYLPGADYLLTWPLVMALPLSHLQLGKQGHGAGVWLVGILSFWAITSLLAPTWYLLCQVGSIHTPAMVTFDAALVAAGVLLFIPHLRLLLSRPRYGAAAIGGILGVTLLIAGTMIERAGL